MHRSFCLFKNFIQRYIRDCLLIGLFIKIVYSENSTEEYAMRLFTLVLALSIILPVSLLAGPDGKRFSISVLPERGEIVLARNAKPIMEIDSIQFNFISPSSMKVKQQSAESIELALLYRNVPDPGKVNTAKDYTVYLSIDKIDDGWHVYAHPRWAHDVSIFLKDLHGHYFGIRENLVPDNHKSPDITGSVQSFDVKGEDTRYHENYASAWSAFFYNSLGYASFFHTFAEGQYKFAINGVTEIYHRTGNLNWYIFTGTNGDEIMKSYYSVIGAPKYVPAWACGVSIWRDEDKNGKEDILNDAKEMTALKIPIMSIMVDRPYSNGINGWSKMDFSPKFSDPGEWIHKLNSDYGLRFMSWVAPCTFGDTAIIRPMPGDHGYIDLSDPKSVSEFDNALTKNIYDYGVQGNKMDRADEAFPIEQAWHDKIAPWERRNKYIYLYAKVMDSVLTAKWGRDNFNYARAGMQGAQKYLSALWGGDSRASWDGLACSVANAMRVGFIGFPDWGSDVGGYLGNAGMEPEELFSRWLQFGTWSGLFEIKLDGAGGQGKDRAPWHYGKTLQANFRRACEERMALAPYVYSQLNTSDVNGVLMKPLAYEYPGDHRTYDIWNEYLFGNSFLVAPVTDPGQPTRDIYLPAGTWCDWYSPSRAYAGEKTYTCVLSEKHIPVFVRQNAIFVTGENWLTGNSVKWNGDTKPSLIINAFPGDSDFTSSFTYVDRFAGDSLKEISISQIGNRIDIRVPALGCAGRVVIYNVVPKGRVTANGEKVDAQIDKDKKSVEVEIEKGAAREFVIERSSKR